MSTPGRRSVALRGFRVLGGSRFGRRLFRALLVLRVPYFGTVRPTVLVLEPGRAEVTMRDRRAVHNHIGTVHAIACCNLAEIVAGLVVDASVPASHRWIPKGMTVAYRAKAIGPLRGVGKIEDLTTLGSGESRDVVVPVDVLDRTGAVVVHADITMWVSPRR